MKIICKNLSVINTLALFGVSLLVFIALFIQLIFWELPCALCNLQRLEFLLFGSGLLIVLLQPARYRWGYLLSGISAIVGACTSITQVFIHILPTDEGGVGFPIFGFHLYAWCFVLFVFAVMYILLAQTIHDSAQGVSEATDAPPYIFKKQNTFTKSTVIFYLLISILATTSVFFANGFGPLLEGGQQKYWLIESIKNPGTIITKEILMQK